MTKSQGQARLLESPDVLRGSENDRDQLPAENPVFILEIHLRDLGSIRFHIWIPFPLSTESMPVGIPGAYTAWSRFLCGVTPQRHSQVVWNFQPGIR